LGILDFPASLIAGLLWRYLAPSAPFYFGGAMALAAALLMALVMPGDARTIPNRKV